MKIKAIKLATSVSVGGVEYNFIDTSKKPIQVTYDQEARKYYLETRMKNSEGKEIRDFLWVHETNVQWARPEMTEKTEIAIDQIPRRARSSGEAKETKTL